MAKTESLKIMLDAENKASAELKRVQLDIKKTVGSVKEVGGQAKASTELVGSLATQLGGIGLGGVAGDVAMLTERVSAFSEVMNTGTKGVLLFKAGLAAAAGIIAFQVGKSIGDVIFQTDKWTKELEAARDAASGLDLALQGITLGKMGKDIDSVNLNLARLPEKLNVAKKELERLQNSGGDFAIYDSDLQERIKTQQESVEQIRKQMAALVDRKVELESQARLNEQKERQDKLDKSAAIMSELQLKAKVATAKTERERLSIQLKAQGVREKDLALAVSLAMQEKQMQEAKKAEQDRIQKAKMDAIKQEKDAIRDLIKTDKERLSELKKQESELKNDKQSQLAGPLTASSSQRLLTGRTGSQFRKTAETIELERQTKIQKALERNAIQQTAILQRIEEKQEQIEVIGN